MIQPTIDQPSTSPPGERDTLSSLRKGETAMVIGLHASGDSCGLLENRLAGMGVQPGAPITVLRAAVNTSRPTLLAIGDTRIALGPEIVERILVKTCDRSEPQP